MKYLFLLFCMVATFASNAQLLPVFKAKEKTEVKQPPAKSKPNSATKKKKITEGYVENYRWKNWGYDAIYTGYIRNGLPNGQGKTYNLDNTIEFEGTFTNGEYSSGVLYMNGLKYKEGNFNEGRHLTGYGKTYSTGKLHYEGNLKNGTFNGQGKLYLSDVEVYEGNFGEMGYREGKGVLKNSLKGYECIGLFSLHFLEGEIRYSDGSRYVGKMSAFENSTNTGNKGIYYFANGDIYEGEFFNKMMHGKGIYTWKYGTKYTGTINSNQLNGNGVLETSSRKITGTFKTLPNGSVNTDENGNKKTWSRPDGTPAYPLQIPNTSY